MQAIELKETEVLEDMQLGGLKIVQDVNLYRFTSDSVLLSRFARAKQGDTVADFCAGSGIVAYHFYALNRDKVKGLTFALFEMQASLAALAKKTATYNGFDNVEIVCGKLQEIDERYREKFSLVLCNPPYIRTGELSSLDTELSAEPRAALDGGEDGLIFYRRLLSTADCWIREGGFFLFEIGYDQAADVARLGKENGFCSVEVKRDLGGNDRVVLLSRAPRID